MLFPIDPAAKKALSLGKDPVFRLLVLMVILLGWLSSMGAAGLAVFESVYHQWQLSQKNHVSIYLMPDSPPAQINILEKGLYRLKGVTEILPLSQADVRTLVAPYIGNKTTLPLPKILDVRVTQDLDRQAFSTFVLGVFPQAEIEDARRMLSQVAQGVRFVQGGAFIIAGVGFTVLALLVAFTVRSGLRAQKSALNILQYIGATNGFLVRLVLQQVWGRAFLGGLLAAVFSGMSLLFLHWMVSGLQGYMTPGVWVMAGVVPLLLVGVVMLAAYASVWHTLKRDEP